MNGRTIAEDMEREYQRQSLRDTFAAAALTGMLGSGDLVIDPRNGTATTLTVLDAYRWADAMLRERSRTEQKLAQSDSSRAACPERDNTSAQTHTDRGSVTPKSYPQNDENRVFYDTKRCTTEPQNGALGEPVAWAVVHANGFGGIVDCYTTKQWCEYHFSGPHFRYVPLYRHPQPTLTDAEREAVERAAANAQEAVDKQLMGWEADAEVAATLRGLLERLKWDTEHAGSAARDR